MANETVEQLKKQLNAIKKDRDMAFESLEGMFELEQRSKQLEKQIKELEKSNITQEKHSSVIKELQSEIENAKEKKEEALSFATKAYEKCKEKIIHNCLLKKKLQIANDKTEHAIKELQEYSDARRNEQYEKKIDELYEIINKQYSYCEQLHSQINEKNKYCEEQYETIEKMYDYTMEQYNTIERQTIYCNELFDKITKQNEIIKNKCNELNDESNAKIVYEMVKENTSKIHKECQSCITLKKQIEVSEKKNKDLRIPFDAVCRELEELKKQMQLQMMPVRPHVQPIQQVRPHVQPQMMPVPVQPVSQQPKKQLNLRAPSFNPQFK